MLKQIIQWFIYSSANRTEYALTLKALVPFLVLLGLGQYTTEADTMIEAGLNIMVAIGQLLSGASLIHGIVRKIWLTARP